MTDDEKTEAVLTTYPDVLILSLVCGFLSFGTAALAGARAATGNLDFLVLVALAVGWNRLGAAGVNFIKRQMEKLT